MPIQTDNLVMLGLGVLSDTPPNSIQPALAEGIHLRFAFARERGFPWHGYYLFRRPHQAGRPLCLGSQFKKEWKPGPWPEARVDFEKGAFSSDLPLAFTELFPQTGQPEFDLRQRRYLRFELPATETAREFHVKIGFIDRAGPRPPDTAKECVDFARLKPGMVSNPYLSAEFEFTALESDGTRSKRIQIQVTGRTSGIFCTGQLSVRLPIVSSSAELTLIASDPRTQVLALDARGKVVDQLTLSDQPGKSQTIRLSGSSISSIKIIASKAGFLLLRACYTGETVRRPLLGPIRLQGFHEQVPVAGTKISGYAGDVVTAVLSADVMTSVEIESGSAVLIDICTVPVSQNLALSWKPLLAEPLCLPVEHVNYPCPGKPSTFAQAANVALARILYGTPADWAGPRFIDLNSVLNDLVALGPSGPAMAERTLPYPSNSPGEPGMPAQSPLDVLLVGSLHPAIAMMLGLYWVDSTDEPGTAYDYMVMADHNGRFHGNPLEALAALAAATPQTPLPVDVDVCVTFNKKRELAPPLAPPSAPQVFALPGAITGPSDLPAARNMAGLRWQLDAAPDGTLLPGEPIGYHLWRCDVGDIQPTAPPSPQAYALRTAERLIIATETSIPIGATRERASDWPPFPLMAFDRGLADGWYSYRLSAVDIWGRHSVMSDPGPWYQWAWPPPAPPKAPAPKPWYYVDPPAERQVNAFAVRLLDKTPPPRPPGVEAAALDPADAMLLKDASYNAWLSAAPAGWWNSPNLLDREQKLGLRVSWRWTKDQMTQAPDTAEFRLYFQAGTEPPAGDYSDPLNWSERIHVVGYNEHVTVVTESNGDQTRLYDVLLPNVGSPDFAGVPLVPSESDPIVYAHIGVSAADGQAHTADNAKWSLGIWGGRAGNEGRVGAPAKIYRVLRTPPPAPLAVDESEKVWATRADYHSRSYYTFRWAKSGTLRAQIYRALDDTLFQTDWKRRQRDNPLPLDPTVSENFPIASWDQPARDAVAAELNALSGPADYGALSDKALRTLASLPGNEKAFGLLTTEPLDPTDATYADRPGPDGTDAYVPSAGLCAFLAGLDGRARNRYFFRAAYVNAAHTAGPLSPSSPPVYLPKVEPPRTPVITGIVSGERQITIKWSRNREMDLAEFRIYRAGDERKARDIRKMETVAIVPSSVSPDFAWTDTAEMVGGRRYYYRLTARDLFDNESAPTRATAAVVVDTQVPPAPEWTAQQWLIQRTVDEAFFDWPEDGVVPAGHRPALRLQWKSETPEPIFVVTRVLGDGDIWIESANATIRVSPDDEQVFTLLDMDVDPTTDSAYRLKVRSSSGVWSAEESIISVAPPGGAS